PNGAGKTTLIRCILGLLKGEGSIHILGYEMPYDHNKIMPKIGYMPQNLSLYMDLSVKESLHFFGKIFGMRNRQERTEAVNKLLNIFLLNKWRTTKVENLSGGMKRRLSLACTLVHDPELIILDEPTVGVDPMLRINFWNHFKELNERGATIITTTHVMDEAEKSRLIGFMRDGKLIAEGTYFDLRRKVPEKRKLIVKVNMENTEKLKEELSKEFGFKTYSENYKINVFYDDDAILDEIIAAIRNKTKINAIQTVEPNLEDTFIFFSAKNNEGVSLK
ncbi:MAG: ATP-binding cassette domain-containing protein, partial [Promethearchaeota archaeon]